MKITLLFAAVLIAFALVACGRRRPQEPKDIVVGGLYASKNQDGTYSISKVLAVDAFAVHVRIYKNKFTEIPWNLDSSVLSLGHIGDSDGFGIGHAPVAKQGWLASQTFLKKEPVREDELDGYRYYLEEMKK